MKSYLVIIGIILSSIVNAQTVKSQLPADRVDVYYLHNTFRCMSCNTIENLTKAAIFGGKAENLRFKSSIEVKPAYKKLIAENKITFQSVNVDEEQNKHLLKDFKADAKFPVLVKIENGKIVKTEVLDQVWNLMNDNKKFVAYIQENLNKFLQDK